MYLCPFNTQGFRQLLSAIHQDVATLLVNETMLLPAQQVAGEADRLAHVEGELNERARIQNGLRLFQQVLAIERQSGLQQSAEKRQQQAVWWIAVAVAAALKISQARENKNSERVGAPSIIGLAV